MKTEVNPFSVRRTRKRFPLILNDVLKIVLVCAQFFSQNFHMVPKVYALLHGYFDCLGYLFFPMFMLKLCYGCFNINPTSLPCPELMNSDKLL